jgi:hypothetical protein
LDLPGRAISRVRVAHTVHGLNRLNLSSTRQIIAPGGPVVSLTSYGNRINSAHLTVESIGLGKSLPSRIILWLDDKFLFLNLPHPLSRLQHRGLEIYLTDNWGPHTKYYPYLESCERFSAPLVTADDDILYPRDWLDGLIRANEQWGEAINCYRARVITLGAGRLAPYEDWHMCTSTDTSVRNFATGVSGVIYPPLFLAKLKQAGRGFEKCCPKADDVWLHAQALRGGFQVRQISKEARHFPMTPGTQVMALQDSNRGGQISGNDRQAASTYNDLDLEMLRTMRHLEPALHS